MMDTASKHNGKVFVRGAVVENTMFYMGSLMTLLASSDETNNGFNLLEYSSQPGHEPPPHIHINQDELLYVLDGEIVAYCQDQKVFVGSGESIFLPRNEAHAWYVLSPKLRMLIFTQPGGLDAYFLAMSVSPATTMELPPASITYVLDDPAHAIKIGLDKGIRILTPGETRELLPRYPGFGVPPHERS
jgi:quercetin dioxygenase-like cupin family protein